MISRGVGQNMGAVTGREIHPAPERHALIGGDVSRKAGVTFVEAVLLPEFIGGYEA